MQEIFPLKVKQKMRQGDLFQISFCLFIKLQIREKRVVITLVSIHFGSD